MDFNKLLEMLFYARKVIAVPSGDSENTELAMTAIKNLSDFGFIPDANGIELLKTADKDAITAWYYETEKKLNEMAGGNHTYKPFYPNFPEEVIEKSDLELFIDQITHYVTVAIGDIFGETNVGWKPEGVNEKENKKSLEEHPLKVFATIGANDSEGILSMATEVFKNTIKSKMTPSAEDTVNIINAYITANPSWVKDVTVVENRKVLSYLYVRALMDKLDTSNMPALITNDYLRIAQVYSYMNENGVTELDKVDISEKDANGKVKEQRVTRLTNSMRRFIATGLEIQKNLEEDIDRYSEQWKVMFKLMHIGTMKTLTKVNAVAEKLRNNKPLNTFNSRIAKATNEGKYEDVVKMYASRPGEFIKALNRMIVVNIENEDRKIAYAKLLVEKSKEVFAKTRPEDLIKLIAYLNSRTREDMIFVHNVKGTLVQTEKVHDTLPVATALVFINLAKEGIAEQIKKAPYGKVYIDSMLANVPLPTEITDVEGAMNAFPRGTRIPVEKNADGTPKNLRVFVWWTNQPKGKNNHSWYGDRVDLDLSVNFFKKRTDGSGLSESMGSVAYHSGYKYENAVVHSGDITDGGPADGAGVCEYVDIDIKKLQKTEVDYVQVYVNSYTGQPFSEVPCLGGWQEREELNKSKQFDVKAVKQVSNMNRVCSGVTMAILDVKAAEVIWVDAPDRRARAISNSLDAISSFDLILERYAKGDQMTMKDMAELAVATNGGEVVENIEDADVIFSVDAVTDAKPEQRVITAKDQDVWIGEFMSPQTPEPEEKLEEDADAKSTETVEEKPKVKSVAEVIADIEG